MGALIELTKEQLLQISELYNQDLGSRNIAKKLKISRHLVQKGFKILDIKSTLKPPRTAHLKTHKICKQCKLILTIDNFRKRIKNTHLSFNTLCYDCESKQSQLNYLENWDKHKEYRIKNKDKIYTYYNQYSKTYYKNKKTNDPSYKLRCMMSGRIGNLLKKNSLSKGGKSCLNFLDYTIDELKSHLQSQFEPWMSWNNWGKYNSKTWNDNDQSTWTWNIDHIIPQCNFHIIDLNDPQIKKCWSLDNLRPLSAKENVLLGNKKRKYDL